MSNLSFYEWLEDIRAEAEGFYYPTIDVLVSRVNRGEILENNAYDFQELFDE